MTEDSIQVIHGFGSVQGEGQPEERATGGGSLEQDIPNSPALPPDGPAPQDQGPGGETQSKQGVYRGDQRQLPGPAQEHQGLLQGAERGQEKKMILTPTDCLLYKLSETTIKMLSQAGRSYARSKAVNPFNTRQRFYSYNLPGVHSPNKSPQHHQSLSTNLRHSRDSYILRHTKETVTHTDYEPNFETIASTHPRPYFARSAFKRYIGDVREEYERKELSPGCDHRCAQANGLTWRSQVEAEVNEGEEKMVTQATSSHRTKGRKASQTIQLQYSPSNPHSIPGTHRKTIAVSDSLDLSKNMSLKSTEPSIIKKRSKNLHHSKEDIHIIPPEPEPKYKGVAFQSSSGHRYGQQLSKPSQNPQTYTLDIKKQAFIRRAIPNPRNYVKFDQFRHKVATRYDRADPNWHLDMDTTNQQLKPKDKSYNFDDYSGRKMNQVQSKYAMRQCMNLQNLPVLDGHQ